MCGNRDIRGKSALDGMLDDFNTIAGYDVTAYMPVIAGATVYNDESELPIIFRMIIPT